MSDEPTITESSGNVFADLGFDDPEEELAKAQLTALIQTIVDRKGWSVAQAASALDMSETELSSLLRGGFGDVSTSHLFRLLTTLDHNVEITVTPREPSQPHASIVVHTELEPAGVGRR
jgi:predicted XRE-type DNA-binding protein